ncbi:MAG: glycosyltransferase family 9 protein [Candidatus Gastranaerophilales bacterium]|nr:glycosyltransferase family 9 protein [Candidatus Gastranaerophilales bacterium]
MTKKKKKILAINFGGIGDEILFFPVLQSLKEAYNCKITLTCEPRSKCAKDLTKNIDKIITCDIKSNKKHENLIKFALKARFQGYDTVISSGSSKFISLLLFLTGIKNRYGYDTGNLSHFLLTKTVKLNKQQYAGNMYHDLIKPLLPNAEFKLPKIDVSKENIAFAKSIIPKNKKKTILIHPGVSQMSLQKGMIKFWSAKNWAELVLSILKTEKYNVIIAGSKDDRSTIRKINYELSKEDFDKSCFIDIAEKTKNIGQLSALILLSNVLICSDSAPMHIGVGTKTKTIAIFGPTDEKKLLPENNKFIAIKNDETTCRPCLWDKRQTTCEKLDCLKISPDKIMELLK